jgi:hypothetical protein
MSIDGYIDDTSPDRLLLSNAEDFDRVDAVRAESDAILSARPHSAATTHACSSTQLSVAPSARHAASPRSRSR